MKVQTKLEQNIIHNILTEKQRNKPKFHSNNIEEDGGEK